MALYNSFFTHVWLFSVGRGVAGFVRTGLNQGMIIDAGNSGDFDTADFIKKTFRDRLDIYDTAKIDGESVALRITQAILSHPHADHISYCEELGKADSLWPALITCPHDKQPTGESPVNEVFNWKHIEEPDDDVHSAYKKLYKGRNLPLQTIEFKSNRTVPNLEYGIYYLPPPKVEAIHGDNDGEYANATSIMLYLRHGPHSILFPGDMTPKGMQAILGEELNAQKRYTIFDTSQKQLHPKWHLETLDQPRLSKLLADRGLSVLVAPHHGLESCFSESLFAAIRGKKPLLNVISDRRNKTDADGTLDARYDSSKFSLGLDVEIDGRTSKQYSVSTEKGHHVLMVLGDNGNPKVYMDKDAKKLMAKLT